MIPTECRGLGRVQEHWRRWRLPAKAVSDTARLGCSPAAAGGAGGEVHCDRSCGRGANHSECSHLGTLVQTTPNVLT